MAEPVVFRRRMGAGAMKKRKLDDSKQPEPQHESDSDSQESSSDQETATSTLLPSSGGLLNRIPNKKRKSGTGLLQVARSDKELPENSLQVAHEVSQESAGRTTNTSDATKQNNWYDEPDLLGRSAGNIDNKTPPSEEASVSKRKVGPIKPMPSNIRSTMVTDYQPDVCKDYKQTGFCGYGDSCKFLHMREDYKAGWQLDREWEEVQQKKKRNHSEKGDEKQQQQQEEEIPFACVICKNPYRDPVVTKCKHYFCEECFLKRSRTSPKCIVCGENTGGSARPAKNVKDMMAHRKK